MWMRLFQGGRLYHQSAARRLLLCLVLLVFGYILLCIVSTSRKIMRKSLLDSDFLDQSEINWTGEATEWHQAVGGWPSEFVAISDWNVSRALEDSLDCDRVFDGDLAYAQANRFYVDDPAKQDLPMDCESVRLRIGLGAGWSGTSEEAKFPLAFVRVVYKDYLFLERELAVNYAPQNWYCYSVDSKSDELFRRRIGQLAKCVPNVLVSRRAFSVSAHGHNTSNAMVECARELASPNRRWQYLVTLQNHDLQAVTNAEMVRIFKWLDGANDIEFGLPTEYGRLEYYLANFKWNFRALQLFKNGSRNTKGHSLNLSKGYCSASLSRAFIDFVLSQLNLDKLLEQLNAASFGVDELLWQSLSGTEALDAPGGFPKRCYQLLANQSRIAPFITRFALWEGDRGELKCRSFQRRHGVCVFGLEDLAHSGPGSLFRVPHLFVNKMLPEFDWGAIKCWHQRMRRRRLAHSERNLDPKHYANWPQTLYNHERRLHTGNGNCS